MSEWTRVCPLAQILPATGVCAWVSGHQIAVFRPSADDRVFALSNLDPFADASVLSRGIIGEHQGELWVASPLKKQRFRLRDGYCMEDASRSVPVYPVRVNAGQVEVKALPARI
ncbi:nitrite reductase small subunit NirD [Pantoea allii]|uniref:Nitrite reductase (NADH) small subunit n=1 Tax=Pantoea allii TaxID=574096 RepID=A0A2V2B847_9GAMM|nr:MULTISPECIES: nitrite reductase small subunit NirD [Pantoea]MBW1216074.1 nitrite reductase small subunit NirD [Pantoea allii]MBW1254315.1 nitrite reductase small subunit NirD [Pantoea allii]MBW1259761.1 nitrite reductase small subunit NirD [Pantoea allii]MBW1263297.1 nitrite reductase small subunit NirD [Pantoea allii]MBW1267298.1 nitrite reductase small subunit NirD [Pantoea allii]